MITYLRPLDHWRLVRRKPDEVARFRRYLSTVDDGQYQLDIQHDGGPVTGRCCKREPWPDTFRRLYPKTDKRAVWVSDWPEEGS